MNLKIGVAIPVFEFTEEETASLKLGLISEDDARVGFEKVVERIFWAVDSAYTYDEETQYSAFYSGGTSFISPMELDDLIKLINRNIKV